MAVWCAPLIKNSFITEAVFYKEEHIYCYVCVQCSADSTLNYQIIMSVFKNTI